MTQADSLLAAEIAEQPEVLETLWREEWAVARAVGREVRSCAPRLCMLVARGTSDHAAVYGKYLVEATVGLPVALAAPSLFTLYRTPPHLDGALVLALSQSGVSPDVVEVVDGARRQGAITVALVNDPGSPLAAAAEHVIPCHAGVERSVAATKSYTAELFAMAMLVAAIAPDSGLAARLEAVLPAVGEAAARGPEIVSMLGEVVAEEAACLVASRGFQYATALELALKLKEMARILAQGYSSADMRHGPITLVGRDLPVVVVSHLGPSAGDMRDLAARCKDLGARVWGITDDPELAGTLDAAAMLPAGVPEALAPIVSAPTLQWWAYGCARARGVDPDRPASIQKVTRTR